MGWSGQAADRGQEQGVLNDGERDGAPAELLGQLSVRGASTNGGFGKVEIGGQHGLDVFSAGW